jgi:hypothetical protein
MKLTKIDTPFNRHDYQSSLFIISIYSNIHDEADDDDNNNAIRK